MAVSSITRSAAAGRSRGDERVGQGDNRSTLRAFVDRDLEAVRRICAEEDDVVDHAYRQLVDELLELMRREPCQVVPAAHFILAARALERIADHTTNVAERIQYMETGILEELA